MDRAPVIEDQTDINQIAREWLKADEQRRVEIVELYRRTPEGTYDNCFVGDKLSDWIEYLDAEFKGRAA